MVLAPLPEEDSDLTNLLQGFDRSGTMGTFVEYVASEDTLRRAGDPPITLTVRAVPDTRVLRISATGDERVVRPGLNAVFSAARADDEELSDLWELRTLEAPSAASPAPPSTALVLLSTIVLAVLGAAVALAVLARLLPGRPAGYEADPDELLAPPLDDEPATSRPVPR